jgi:long-chain fatty acid transport protein
MRSFKFFVAWLVFFGAAEARASTEINGLFDARSGGMAGTGVAFLDSAGAVPTNPALLDQIHKVSATLDLFYIVSQPEAPYTVYHLNAAGQRYQSWDTIQSPPTSAVLPFIGGAFRLPGALDRVVFGTAAYPIIGQGTSAVYRSAPDELPNLQVTNKASLGFYEIGNAVSVRVLDNLSFGATWRITYMTQSVTTAVPGGPPAGVLLDLNHNPLYGNIDASGFNFGGYQLGLLYKPIPFLRLGFSYRSKVVVHADGKTKTENPLSGTPLELDTHTSFTYPHAFRGGAAVSLLKDTLLLAVEFKYLMYAEAFKTLTTTVVNNGKPSDTVQPLYWKDSFNLLLGAEYKLGMCRVRAGYTLVTSATNEAYAVQFMAPPGVSHLVTGGFGVELFDHLNVDLSAGYVVLATHVDVATVNNSGIGEYASHGGEFSLGVTYHN